MLGLYIARMVFLISDSDKPSNTTVGQQSGNPIEGTSFTLTCVVNGGRPDPGPSSYTWWKDNELLDEKSDTLTLEPLDHEEHDGTYTCAAANHVGRGPTSDGELLQVYCEYT